MATVVVPQPRYKAKHMRMWSLVCALLITCGLLAIFAPGFFRPEHLQIKLVANAPILVAAIGMTLVILARQIDISIGSQFSLCGIVAALMAQNQFPNSVAVLGAIGCGALIGMINGWLVAKLKLPAIVVTLAMMVIIRESLRWWREGEFVRNLQEDWQWWGLGQSLGQWMIVVLCAVVFSVASVMLNRHRWGREIYAIGSNLEGARLVGIRSDRLLIAVFVAMGALTGLAAALNAARFGDIDPNSGTGLELQVIAAVVVGGTSVSGGRGNLLGTLLGVLLLGIIGPALVFFHIEPQWEKALQGLIILAAIAAEAKPKQNMRGRA